MAGVAGITPEGTQDCQLKDRAPQEARLRREQDELCSVLHSVWPESAVQYPPQPHKGYYKRSQFPIPGDQGFLFSMQS